MYQLDECDKFYNLITYQLGNRYEYIDDDCYLLVSNDTLHIYPFAMFMKLATINKTGEHILVVEDINMMDEYPFYYRNPDKRYFDWGNYLCFYGGDWRNPSIRRENYDCYILDYDDDYYISEIIQTHVDKIKMLEELNK